MTANAMKGDREICLAAGMDGYVSKPIRQQELFAAIAEATSDRSPLTVEPSSESTETPHAAHGVPIPEIDQNMHAGETYHRDATNPDSDPLDGDRELRRELADMFLEDCPKLLAQIQAALTSHDGPELKLAAHTLKGSAGVFKDAPSFEAALRMEHAGRDANWPEADQAWIVVQAEMARLSAMLAAERDSST